MIIYVHDSVPRLQICATQPAPYHLTIVVTEAFCKGRRRESGRSLDRFLALFIHFRGKAIEEVKFIEEDRRNKQTYNIPLFATDYDTWL